MLLRLLSLGAANSFHARARADVIAQTDGCGNVSGSLSHEPSFGTAVHTFKSIPYAVPPIGHNRWKPPTPLFLGSGSCWTGTLDGSEYRAQCAQGSGSGSEDCLTLSVFQGGVGLEQKELPVMVYFHGGDLTGGNGETDFSALAAGPKSPHQPMVIVAVQYRLTVFGFLASAELATGGRDSRGNVTGNYGFLDQQESLRWVQRNIHNFNGDRNRVTIFGQSSGGTSVLALVVSPASAGLFHRALSLSGSPNITIDLVSAQRQHGAITEAAGCGGSRREQPVLDCLLNKSALELLRAVPQSWGMPQIFDIPRHADGLEMPAVAVVDGVTVPGPVLQSLAVRGAAMDVPIIISSMAQECGAAPGARVADMSAADFNRYLSQVFGDANGTAISEQYARMIGEGRQLAFDSIQADSEVTCGNLALSRAAASAFKSPVYSLVNSAFVSETSWAYHGLDLSITIEADKTPVLDPHRHALGTRLREAWYEFASNGKVASWKAANEDLKDRGSSSDKGIWQIDFRNNGTTSTIGLRQGNCAFWAENGFSETFWWSN